MRIVIALAVGYVIGAAAGSRELDEVQAAFKSLRETEEFGHLLVAARSHAGATLRDLADMVEGGRQPSVESADLVDHVKLLFGREDRGR